MAAVAALLGTAAPAAAAPAPAAVGPFAVGAPAQLPVPLPVPTPGSPQDPGGGAPPAAGQDQQADPPPLQQPKTAADAKTQLDQVQRDAEALTEQWHAAQDDLAARRDDVTKMQAAVAPAQAALDKAKADEETYRKQVDVVSSATFEAGNLDQLDALLAAKSPQDYLDQMSALETISAQYKDVLDTLIGKVDTTTAAQGAASDAVARAQAAADQATKAEQDLSARKREAEIRIDQAEKLLQQLTPAQRRERDDNGVDAPDIVGSGVGVDALRAAATQLGKPYQWGATGPNSYDCSGLTSWAFKKAGITLPRSSSQQATVGRAVSWDDMQPGDLVFYYSPISHVGIYAGNGTFINAPQTGDVVKYQTVSRSAFATARRL